MIVKNIEEIEERKLVRHGDALYRPIFGDFASKAMACWQTKIPAGVTLPPHKHSDQEQLYFILEGKGKVTVGGEEQRVKVGDVVYLPAKIDHGFQNDGEKSCILFAVGTLV